MKKHFLLLTALLFILPSMLLSQQKQLSIEDASYMNRSIMPASVRGLGWMGNSNIFTYKEDNNVMASKATSDKHFKLFSLDDINKSLAKLEEDSLHDHIDMST